MSTVVSIPSRNPPPLRCTDWRVHRNGPGRPPDLTRPANQIKAAVEKRIDRLCDKRARIEREITRWNELEVLLDVRLPTNGNGHAA